MIDTTEIMIQCAKHGERETLQFGSRPPRCPACVEQEIEERRKAQDAERDEWYRQQRIADADEAVPPRYRAARLADFPSETVEKVKAWVEKAKTDPVSLMIFGPVGTGKTHLACCITRAVILANIGGRYVSQANYLREIRKTWDNDSSKSEESVFASFTTPRVLVLDDIGAARANDNDVLRLGELISERYDLLKPSVFVTNLTPADLKTYVGNRSYDRMRDNAEQLVLNGETKRKAA